MFSMCYNIYLILGIRNIKFYTINATFIAMNQMPL